jgi:DNA-binding MarR family transcriptional regulator
MASSDGRETELTLGLLAAVEQDSGISQRRLSRELGVALGLANAYLMRCVRKGLIKIKHVPRGRYAYYLTPKGFAEKARLTGEYLTYSLQFYRRARTEFGDEMARCAASGWRRVILVGATELAEIATLTAQDYDIVIIGVLDGRHPGVRFCGLPVFHDVADAGAVDAVILTTASDLETTVAPLAERLGATRVLAPALVRVGKPKARKRDGGQRAANVKAEHVAEAGKLLTGTSAPPEPVAVLSIPEKSVEERQ